MLAGRMPRFVKRHSMRMLNQSSFYIRTHQDIRNVMKYPHVFCKLVFGVVVARSCIFISPTYKGTKGGTDVMYQKVVGALLATAGEDETGGSGPLHLKIRRF